MSLEIKKDKYKRRRGGNSRILEINCSHCGNNICIYQKDGLGLLKRMYLDRISDSQEYSGLETLQIKDLPNLICGKCRYVLGVPFNYKKENRLSFRLFAGAVSKSIIKTP